MAYSVTIQKWNWWYDSIIDMMLANPESTQNEIAKALNVTPTWLSIVKNTDMFQERFHERRAMMSQNIDAAIQGKVANLAMKALDMTLERLESEGAARIPTASIMEIADKSLNRLGYGVKQAGPQVVVNNNTVSVGASKEALLEARSKIRENESKLIEAAPVSKEVLDAAPPLLPPGGPEMEGVASPLERVEDADFDPLNFFLEEGGANILSSEEAADA